MQKQNPAFQIPSDININMRPKMGRAPLVFGLIMVILCLYAYIVETTFLGYLLPKVPVISALMSDKPEQVQTKVSQQKTQQPVAQTNAIPEIPPEFIRSERTMVLNMVHKRIKRRRKISPELRALDKRVIKAIIENRPVHRYPEQGNIDIQLLAKYKLLRGLQRDTSKNQIGRAFGCCKGYVVLD